MDTKGLTAKPESSITPGTKNTHPTQTNACLANEGTSKNWHLVLANLTAMKQEVTLKNGDSLL